MCRGTADGAITQSRCSNRCRNYRRAGDTACTGGDPAGECRGTPALAKIGVVDRTVGVVVAVSVFCLACMVDIRTVFGEEMFDCVVINVFSQMRGDVRGNRIGRK